MFLAWQRDRGADPGADRSTWWRPWLHVAAEITGRGVRVQRARIIVEPVSEYIQVTIKASPTPSVRSPCATSAATNPPSCSPTTIAAPAKDLFTRYAERMIIENELDAYLSGFHLDALTSGVPLNVDLNLRTYHPALIDAGFADLDQPIPWLDNRRVRFRFPPR